MNNTGSACTDAHWADGIVDVGHDQGTPPDQDPQDCYVVRRQPIW